VIGRREFMTVLGGAAAQWTSIDKSYRTRVDELITVAACPKVAP
jgi:hypothetical protein